MEDALVEIGTHLDGFGFQHYRALERRQFNVAANWKLVSDLSLESYHFKTVHRDSVAQILAPNAVVDTFGRHSLWAFPFKSILQLAEHAVVAVLASTMAHGPALSLQRASPHRCGATITPTGAETEAVIPE